MPEVQVPREVVAVIVSYRSAELTARAVASLLDERRVTGLPDHIVVVDNHSGDYPHLLKAAHLGQWGAAVEIVDSPRNGGFGAGNNLGVCTARASGTSRYYLFLNPDTICRNHVVRELKAFLDGQPQAGLVGSSFENGDGSMWPIAFRFPSLLSEVEEGICFGPVSRLLRKHTVSMQMPQDRPSKVDWVAGACVLVRADLFHTLGGFDEAYFLYFEETDLSLRATRLGWSTWYQPAARVVHIAGQSTKVTERDAAPRRLPAYWYESRRRYFQINRGVVYALAVDIAALLATLAGRVLASVRRRTDGRPPHFAIDVARHSALGGRVALAPRKTSVVTA